LKSLKLYSSSPRNRIEEILCRVLELFVSLAIFDQALRGELTHVVSFVVAHSRPGGDFG
jgi:hypothetical protein